MIKEYGNEFDNGVETSQKNDSVSLDNIIVEKLRKMSSLRTQKGDKIHGSTIGENSLRFEDGRGFQKELLGFSPRLDSKLRSGSSTTSVV